MSSTKREQHQLVALWYGASIVAVCTAKEALLAVPAPASLCVVQFGLLRLALGGCRVESPLQRLANPS